MQIDNELNTASILLADSHTMFRETVARSLSEHGMVVVGDVGTVDDVLAGLSQHSVDLVISTIALSDMSGLAWIEDLKRLHPQVKVILLTDHEDIETFISAVRIDVDGYVMKSSPFKRLLRVVKLVLSGCYAFDVAICSMAMRELVLSSSDDKMEECEEKIDISELSVRERQVVNLLSKGLSNKEIAFELSISISTVKTHISRIFKRFGISSRRELLPKFYKLSYLTGTQPPRLDSEA